MASKPPFDWHAYFLQQAIHGGNGYAFQGSLHQRGQGIGSIFKTLMRFIVPLGKRVARNIGPELLAGGLNVVDDVLSGQNLGESLKTRGRTFVGQAKTKLTQGGTGKKKKKGGKRKGKKRVKKGKVTKKKAKPRKKKRKKRKPVSRGGAKAGNRFVGDIFGNV